MQLTLKGFQFQELFTAEGVQKLDQTFLQYLQANYTYLYDALQQYRQGAYSARENSDVIISLAPILEHFIADLFNIEEAVVRARQQILLQDPIFAFKEFYVLKKAKRQLRHADAYLGYSELTLWLTAELQTIGCDFNELNVAKLGIQLLADEQINAVAIDKLTQWCVQVLSQVELPPEISEWVVFKLPHKLNYAELVPIQEKPDDPVGRLEALPKNLRQRDGFGLTDQRMSQREILNEIHYCVICHDKEGDFCSKGFPVKKGKPELGYKRSPLNEILTGCPLEEKISEMQWLKKIGYGIGALATIMIDNPMCPATGHRICNDCMKSCIYQKQDPVNVPQVETGVLTDVLALPWGVEIYDLLTRWNPLRQKQYVMQQYNGLKVLVMGMGPAGFTLAHHLLMSGCAVVGADGLKIEPMPEEWITKPIYEYANLIEALDERVMRGFGGVAEYGITVRWDKNFLKLILISLLRCQYFQLVGSIRFGGTLTVEDAWNLGFDHLAVAVGAGLPKELMINNSMAPGMRQANDFLMALQLTGALKQHSLANLQIRLPAVVIGSGLTAVDTATEIQAYYLVQIERTAKRYHALISEYGVDNVRHKFSQADLSILDEMLAHAHQLNNARQQAQDDGSVLNTVDLIRQWGGVTIVYRRGMTESPAYRRNHEELTQALAEGIYYAEGLNPVEVRLDEYGHCKALLCQSRIQNEEGVWMLTDETQVLPARAILAATGAKPNVAYGFEHKGTIIRRQFEYARFDVVEGQLKEVKANVHVKTPDAGPFTSYEQDGRYVSFLGDTHPVFHGSVVNAIASAQRFYPDIMRVLQNKIPVLCDDYKDFKTKIEFWLQSSIVAINEPAANLIEIIISSPQATLNYKPGQFFRLQNYETGATTLRKTPLQIEAISAIGIVDPASSEQLRFVIDKTAASTKLLARWQVGQRISLMGPTGASFPVQSNATWMVIGSYLALAQVLALAPELKRHGSKLIFVSLMPEADHAAYADELGKVCSEVITVVDSSALVSTLVGYFEQNPNVAQEIKQVQVFAAVDLLKMVQAARHQQWQPFLHDKVKFIGSVFGPMQCMLKGVCAQCLQWQIDPKTGQRTKAVYACSWQSQPMEMIDMDNMNARYLQNQMQKKLSDLWVDYCLEEPIAIE